MPLENNVSCCHSREGGNPVFFMFYISLMRQYFQEPR